MTHKVHPKIYRIKEITDWKTRGYYRSPKEYLEEDFIIRQFLNKKIGKMGVEKIEIERFPNRLNIIVFSARPGLIIGRGGEEIEKLKKELEKKLIKISKSFSSKIKKEKKGAKRKEKKTPDLENLEIKIEIKEIKDFWSSAELAAQWIAQRIEKRISYRRVLKQSLSKIMANKEVKGARVEVAGRLDGSEMSRRQWIMEGNLPRSTIRANIDYAKAEAHCTYGTVGIKVWIYKGEKFD